MPIPTDNRYATTRLNVLTVESMQSYRSPFYLKTDENIEPCYAGVPEIYLALDGEPLG